MNKLREIKRPDNLTLAVILSPLWTELVFKGAHFGGMLSDSWTYLLPQALSVGAVIWVLSALFGRYRRIAAAALAFMMGILMCAVIIYYDVFGVMPALYSLTGANQAAQFWREILISAFKLWPWVALSFAPVAVILSPACKDSGERPNILAGAAGFILLRVVALVLILSSDSGLYSAETLYTGEYLAMRSVRVFGVQTAAYLDARTLLFGTLVETEIPIDTLPEEPETEAPEEEKTEEIPIPVTYNEMDFDFAALAAEEQNKNISALHSYFASQQPTNQNDYTGIFKGKNLVLVTAEGWSPYAVSEEITPTLYKMLNDGFVFEQFYNPIWGVSTTDGEYAACMGLIPKNGVWSFYHSHDNYMPLCMGKQMTALDYTAKAYHNHFFDYYSRHLSHPNMGYDYKGYGNGLDITYIWPESDEEMIHVTVDEYINSEPFIAYYMTVSGHLAYTFSGNNMARAHRDVVDHLELSDDAKAYIACNYELELAMSELLARLEEKGIADDTVFCIVPDHYPYGLLEETQNELAGHIVDRDFEIYESCLVIWSPSMQEPVYVPAPTCPLDIVPTLSNLFGIEYDSRLLMGRDALSDSDPLVVFNTRSWITDLGRYNADKDEFIPSVSEEQIPEGYIESVCTKVDAKFAVSEKILDTDYYRVLWQKSGMEIK